MIKSAFQYRRTEHHRERERLWCAHTRAILCKSPQSLWMRDASSEEKLNWLSITLVIHVLFDCIISGRWSNRLKFYMLLYLSAAAATILYSLSWDADAVIHFRLDFSRPAAAQDMDRICEGLRSAPVCSSLSRVKRDLLYYTLQE